MYSMWPHIFAPAGTCAQGNFYNNIIAFLIAKKCKRSNLKVSMKLINVFLYVGLNEKLRDISWPMKINIEQKTS